jgi:enamine deaminase RidA (YjgF/YER057c/UK114 family)
MGGRVEERLARLGIELPRAGAPAGNYVPTVFAGGLLFLSGQLCGWNDERRFIGRLGHELTIEQGQQAARICGMNIIAHLRNALGDLDRVIQCVRLSGFVHATADFTEHAKVLNGCSDLMVEVFGDAGWHTRVAVGATGLPYGMAVEVESIFEVRRP